MREEGRMKAPIRTYIVSYYRCLDLEILCARFCLQLSLNPYWIRFPGTLERARTRKSNVPRNAKNTAIQSVSCRFSHGPRLVYGLVCSRQAHVKNVLPRCWIVKREELSSSILPPSHRPSTRCLLNVNAIWLFCDKLKHTIIYLFASDRAIIVVPQTIHVRRPTIVMKC